MGKPKKYQTTEFYEKCVPTAYRRLLTKQDFYSQLDFIMNEITAFINSNHKPTESEYEKFNLSYQDKRIVYSRYIQNKTILTISNEFNVSVLKLKNVINKVANIITNYIIEEVACYPIRFAFLKERDIKNKPDIRKLYRAVPDKNITVSNFASISGEYIENKYKNEYENVLNYNRITIGASNFLNGKIKKWLYNIDMHSQNLCSYSIYIQLIEQYEGRYEW